ncbi:MAG: hypothetical protein M1825_001364 [Sarcosagium campestre]|nr:MAG: hypothetical protein M1825_001364 [Sarcosagium campestre]
MWKVDPETRGKASPKFGTFICLTCAGTHRGLGVHISFVRSVSMDAFKVPEIARMTEGGNKAWRSFFETHPTTKADGVSWDECTIAERYSGEVGEEYKDRLTAKAEGKDYVPAEKKKPAPATQSTSTSKPNSAAASRSATPLGRKPGIGSESPATAAAASRKAANEAHFARLGQENASRPDGVAPNQGGKYTGFGSEPAEPVRDTDGAPPGIDDFQKDPVAALTKGFGWFSAAVGKSAKTVNEGFIQPTAQKIAEADLAKQARIQAAQLGQNVKSGTLGAADSFNRFVEGPSSSSPPTSSGARRAETAAGAPEKADFWDSFGEAKQRAGPEPEKQDFWDSFGGDGAAVASTTTKTTTATTKSTTTKPSSIGTAAMRKGDGKEDEWQDDKW